MSDRCHSGLDFEWPSLNSWCDSCENIWCFFHPPLGHQVLFFEENVESLAGMLDDLYNGEILPILNELDVTFDMDEVEMP